MVDLTEEDVAKMTQDFKDLKNATAVSTAQDWPQKNSQLKGLYAVAQEVH